MHATGKPPVAIPFVLLAVTIVWGSGELPNARSEPRPAADDATAKASEGENVAVLKKTLDALRREVDTLRKELRQAQEDRDKWFARVVELTDRLHEVNTELKRGSRQKADQVRPCSVQVRFMGPQGMQVFVGAKDRRDETTPTTAPACLEFRPGSHELKLTMIPGRAGVRLYPRLEIPQPDSKAIEFLDHAQVPVRFTEEDFDQVLSGNLVTKVTYLPDPEFQELALAGIETFVATRLDPGVNPIQEADRRGTIVAIVRLGNKDKETPKVKNSRAKGESRGTSAENSVSRRETGDSRKARLRLAELVQYRNASVFLGSRAIRDHASEGSK